MSIDTTRRRFLQTFAVASLVHPVLSSAGRPLSAQTHTSGPSEPFWEEVRRQFAFRDERVPMNAANLCPSPRVVAERVSQLTRDIDVDCSFPNRQKFGPLLEHSREAVARQLGVTADEIALVRNTSEANNIINAGLPLDAGADVVLWDQNHPTNNVAWDVRAARYGLAVIRVTTPPAPSGIDELVAPFERALTPRTRVLALTHVSNVSGVKLPVGRLCEIAHQRGIHVHVDGAQSWGNEVEPRPRGARKFESLGQRDDAALAAIGTTVAFQDRIGMAHVEARVGELTTSLKVGLREAGFEMVTPMAPELSGGVVIAAVDPARRASVVAGLYEQHGIAGAPTGGLRLCPHIYNTREHVERAVRGAATLRDEA